jgi:hypothetical protein
VLEPVDDFLTQTFGKRPLHVEGPKERFLAPGLTAELERTLEAPIILEPGKLPREPVVRDRDLLVLQLEGRVQWRASLTEEPSFEATLAPGGLLYIPRHWSCAAVELEVSEAKLLGIDNPTGAGLLRWIAGKLESAPIFQTDIPRFGGPAEQAAYLTAMRHALRDVFRLPDLLFRYRRRLNDRQDAVRQETAHGLIAIAAPRIPKIRRRTREIIYIAIGGVEFEFPIETTSMIQFILDRAPLPRGEFDEYFAEDFDADERGALIAALLDAGAIAI